MALEKPKEAFRPPINLIYLSGVCSLVEIGWA